MTNTAELLQRITVRPGQCGGRPCIRGMRIRVIDVLELLASGMSHEEILKQLPDLEEEDIRASLAYAARYMDHPRLVASA
jgi:uncharacterized protein (DUF433 family)